MSRGMHRGTASRVIGAVTLGWLACFTYLALSPEIPDLPGIAAHDEVLGAGHLVASLILTALTYMWLVSALPDASPLRAAALAFGAASAFGLVIELVQIPVPEREPQLGDAGLDLLGSAIAVIALATVSPPTLRRPQVPAIVGTLGAVLVASTTAVIVWGTTATPAEQRCPGAVSGEPLPAAGSPALPFGEADRIDDGLVGLFDFTGPGGGRSAPLDLVARGDVEQLDPVGVRLAGDDAVLSSAGSAAQLVDAIVDQFTLEAWVRPDRLAQAGPARIVSNSGGVALSEVNLQLGQDRHCLSVRVDAGGREAEWLLVEDVFDRPQTAWHLVVTYDAGTVRIFVDGEHTFEASLGEAELSGWSRDYPLLVGNEVTRDRPFLGDVYLVAVYDRALSPGEVARNYDAGVRAGPSPGPD